MGSPHLIGPPAPREAEDAATRPDWKKAIPVWALQLALACALTTCGWLWGRVDKLQDKQIAMIEAANKNAAALYTSQLSERVATLEADSRADKEWKSEMSRAMKSVTTSNERIAAKVEFMLDTQRRLTR